ncbi:MAG: SPOR domain-containing protein [Erythrobacter sp.]
MARRNSSRNQSLSGKHSSGPNMALFISTALASMALAGCAASAPAGEVSFAKAQTALEDGKVDRAVTHAEAAVLAEPRNAGYRAMLGAAYLESGRFASASTAFGEAIDLGDEDPRTVLSFALTKVALGENDAAVSMLRDFETAIPSADLGLALALAGQPEQGVHHLVNTIRNGNNTSKARQNLAYAYALAGNWPAARVMAAEDVPADQIDARLADWAATARPEDYQVRVAGLLGINPVSDAGQPQHLALANFPSQPMLVAEAQQARAEEINADVAPELAAAEVESSVPVSPRQSEAMAFGIDTVPAAAPASNNPEPVGTFDPTPAPVRVAAAPTPVTNPSSTAASLSMPAVAAAPARVGPRFVSNAVVQAVPERASAPRRAPTRAATPAPQRRMAVATGSSATHLVQLGSFSTRALAEGKWREMKSRWPQLADHDVVITEAQVNGRTYFRVAAAGFGQRSARNMCNSVKSSGGGCFAYAAANPPAGAVDRGVRIAARTR